MVHEKKTQEPSAHQGAAQPMGKPTNRRGRAKCRSSLEARAQRRWGGGDAAQVRGAQAWVTGVQVRNGAGVRAKARVRSAQTRVGGHRRG